ncbi:recombinase family protein [Paenibacillus sp. YN15]|uniref:recombinase family protein n=1 Tax=Paenibacillus sp. YN15 TaxID=1742774 RepID=UPI00215D406F|nr:recombinase family protein [Paenibacillus sp. YN15]
MRENAIQGFHCGGRAPYGYRLKRNGVKVTYEYGPDHEVETVKLIFQLAAEGWGGRRIATFLNQQKIDSKVWRPSTVLSLLSNHAYLGYRTWNKKSEVDGHKNPPEEWIVTKECHPAIIDKEIWDAAHREVSLRKLSAPK